MHTEYINGICVNTVLIDFPTGRVKGCVTKNEDESYTIFLNARLSIEAQKQAYDHELRHIIREDFSRYDVESIELNNH